MGPFKAIGKLLDASTDIIVGAIEGTLPYVNAYGKLGNEAEATVDSFCATNAIEREINLTTEMHRLTELRASLALPAPSKS